MAGDGVSLGDARAVAREVAGSNVDESVAVQALIASAQSSDAQGQGRATEGAPSLSLEAQALVNAIVEGASGGTVVLAPPPRN